MVTGRFGQVVLIMFALCLFVASCGKRSREDAITLGKPPDIALDGDTYTWRGISVGETTRRDVLSRLGIPETAWSFGNLEVFRYLPQGYKREISDTNTYYKLVLREGVVEVVLIEVWGYHYKELLREIGDPERVVDYPAQHDVAIFASRGITAVLVGLPGNYSVSYLQYYIPNSLEGYLEGWGQFHPEELPWQRGILSKVDSLDFVPGKTSRQEVENLLEQPDFEWLDKADGGRRIYYYHIPGTISKRFHRFVFQQDILTWMYVETQERRSLIDDAIRDLGNVSTVIRLYDPPDVAKPIQYYCWPEKGIVLVAEMAEVYSPLQFDIPLVNPNIRPNGADVVVARVQFLPLSLDEFIEQEAIHRITEEIGESY